MGHSSKLKSAAPKRIIAKAAKALSTLIRSDGNGCFSHGCDPHGITLSAQHSFKRKRLRSCTLWYAMAAHMMLRPSFFCSTRPDCVKIFMWWVRAEPFARAFAELSYVIPKAPHARFSKPRAFSTPVPQNRRHFKRQFSIDKCFHISINIEINECVKRTQRRKRSPVPDF